MVRTLLRTILIVILVVGVAAFFLGSAGLFRKAARSV